MRALALALVVAGAVSGCGGSSSGAPRTLPAVTPSVSPTAAASAAPVVDVPVAARAADSAGAEAFARFVYAQIERGFTARNPALVSAISAPTCAACSRFISSISSLRDQGGRIENFRFRIVSAVAPAVADNAVRVDVTWALPNPAIWYDTKGKVVLRDGPYSRVDDEVSLRRRGESWVVTDMTTMRRRR